MKIVGVFASLILFFASPVSSESVYGENSLGFQRIHLKSSTLSLKMSLLNNQEETWRIISHKTMELLTHQSMAKLMQRLIHQLAAIRIKKTVYKTRQMESKCSSHMRLRSSFLCSLRQAEIKSILRRILQEAIRWVEENKRKLSRKNKSTNLTHWIRFKTMRWWLWLFVPTNSTKTPSITQQWLKMMKILRMRVECVQRSIIDSILND